MRKSRRAASTWALLLVTSACSSDGPNLPGLEGNFDNPSGVAAGRGGGKGGKSGGLADGECANGLVVTTRVAPRVVLVLDGSCSMSTNYPANGQESATQCTNNPSGRWTALRNALIDPRQGVVPQLQSVVEFGVVVFGTSGSCPIPGTPVPPALNNLAAIQGRIPNVQPGQFTPTGPALDWVYDNLVEAQGPDSKDAPQVVILATDGEPNSCGGGGGGGGRNNDMQQQAVTNYQPSLDALKKGTAKGATTYVISLADATGPFHDHLQELANLGNPAAKGKAKLYEPTSPAQLKENLESLVGSAVGCDIELNGAIESGAHCSGTVKLDGKVLGCDDKDGWKLIDENHIRLQGKACDTLTSKNDASIEADFPCNVFNPD